MTSTILLAVAFGSVNGLLLALVGGGGSIMTVPILVYVLDQPVHDAAATSLVIVGVTALVGAIPHARAGRVATKPAMIFGGSGVAGAFAGVALNARVSGPVILLLFGLLMLGVAVRMAFNKQAAQGDPDAKFVAGLGGEVIVSGLVVGILTGFFGVGGGFLIVPALVLVLGLPMRLAVGTSLVVIAINAVAGIAAHLGSGGINPSLALLFIAGGVVGAALGGRLSGMIGEAKLAQGFAVLVGATGLYLIARNGAAMI